MKNIFKGRRILLVLAFMVVLAIAPLAANADAFATASTAGFGAAFGYAQNIGPVAFTQAGSIGNGDAFASANTGSWSAWSSTTTGGPAAAFAQSIGTPFGSAAWVQLTSFSGGFASGSAFSAP